MFSKVRELYVSPVDINPLCQMIKLSAYLQIQLLGMSLSHVLFLTF